MIIQRISRYISNFENLMPLFAAACAVLAAIAILSLPFVYAEDQLYPKHIDKESPLDPYDRGGSPFTRADIVVQYPENSPTAGYVTAYLTPFSWALANTTLHTGTTIVGHPGVSSMKSSTTRGGLIPWWRRPSCSSPLPLPPISSGRDRRDRRSVLLGAPGGSWLSSNRICRSCN